MTDARIVLIGQVHELIDQIERTTYLFRGDDEGRRQAEGCIAHARKVSAPFNYNGPSIERQELADAQAEIARLRGALEPHRSGPDFYDWIADRLVHVYGESEGVDFVLTLRRRAQLGREALKDVK